MKLRGLLVVFVIVWAALATIGYFVVHKPVLPDRALALTRAAALLRLLLVVGWWGVIVMAAGGLGRLLTGDRGQSPVQRIVFSLGVGFGVLSGLTLVAGLLGLLSFRAAWVVALILLAGVAWLGPLKKMARDLRDALPRRWPEGRLARIACAFVALMLAMAFVWALAPPAAWDSLTYHLNGPQLYVEQGRIAQTVDLPYLGFPQLAEMLYTLALIANLAAAAQLIHWTFAALIVALLVDVTARHWDRPAGWLAAAIFLSAPTVFWLAGWAYVDLPLTFYSFAAFVVLTQDDTSLARLILAGAMCGLAMATKYTAASVALALAVLAFRAKASRDFRAGLTSAIRFGLAAGLTALPWYLKTWITTGNPVYPFFLPGVFWDSWRGWWYGRWDTGLAFTAPWKLLTAPFEMAVLGIEGAEGFGATMGPLLLMLAPLIAVFWRRLDESQRKLMRSALVMCGIVYAVWLVQAGGSGQLIQTRLLLPIFPLLAMMATAGFEGLRELEWPQLSTRRVVGSLVVLTLALTAGGLAWDLAASDRLQFLAGSKSRDDYLLAHLGTHYAAMQAVNELPPGSRVLFLWEPRSFYCQVECWPDSLLDRWWHLQRTTASPEGIAAQWRAGGFTHVLLFRKGYQVVVEQGFDPISPQDQQALEALLVSQFQLARDVHGTYELYTWR